MAEYIELQKVYEMLHGIGGCGAEPESWADGWDKAIDTAINELRDIPAADVAPVIHAIWGKIRGGPAVCTNCKNWYGNAKGKTDQRFYQKFRYCPNCGAKMDGKDGTEK